MTWARGGAFGRIEVISAIVWAPRYILFYSYVYSAVHRSMHNPLYSKVFSRVYTPVYNNCRMNVPYTEFGSTMPPDKYINSLLKDQF